MTRVKKLLWGGAVGLMVAMGFVSNEMKAQREAMSPAEKAAEAEAKRVAGLRPRVVSLCQESVLAQLKSPATAKFAPPEKLSANEMPNKTWLVASSLDSQNGFGALVRSEYICKVKVTANGLEVFDQKITTRR